MSKARDPIAVIGAGPSGLLQALYLAKVRRRPVILVEQQATIGGILRSGDTPWGPADQGVYIFQESGHSALDDLYFDCLPREDWHILTGVWRDIGGSYFAGSINFGALFPDLRRLPPDDHHRCLEELAACAAKDPLDIEAAPNLEAYLSSRFGPHAVSRAYAPFIRKFWKKEPDELAAAAAAMVHMSRVVACDMEQTMALKQDAGWNAILGAPDQMTFPTRLLSSSDACLYPRDYGTIHVLNGLERALRRHGVEIFTGVKVMDLDVANGAVVGLQIAGAAGARTIPVSGVLWASASGPLLKLTGGHVEAPMEPPVPHRVVNLFLDRPPETGPLYWLWSYDPSTEWVRFSSGAAYCPGASARGAYPVCVETHVADSNMPDDLAAAQVEREIRACGLITASTKVVGAYIQPGVKGFFVPSLANCASLQAQRAAIELNHPSNLFITGQDVASRVFFLPDVLSASLPALNAL